MAAGTAAELFFRSEYVDLLDEKMMRDGPTHGSGIVERVTFLGNSGVIIPCGEIAVRVRAHPTSALQVKEQGAFRVAPESCIVFPA